MTTANATAGRLARPFSAPAVERENWPFLVAFALAHVPIAFLLQASSTLATVHAVGALALGMLFLRDAHAERVVYVVGYIAAMEIVWRGVRAQVFWEFGKYAGSLLLLLAVIRYRKLVRAPKLPALFLLLLVPSIAVLPYFDREDVAFNLSGPFNLAVATFFFGAVRFDRVHLRDLILVMMGPIIALGALSLRSSFEADLTMLVAGSKATSGGIGPNQVSTILGLGIFLAFLLSRLWPPRSPLRWLTLGLGLWLAAQCLLSFSRGGLWSAFGATFVAGLYLARRQGSRRSLFAAAVVLFVIFNYLLFPFLDQLTAGSLSDRFKSTDTTGRFEIIEADLLVFSANPWLGVGPGQSRYYHYLTFRESGAHTEYSRLLAEHGSLGALALLTLGWLVFSRWLQAREPLEKAVVFGLTAWALLSMFHAATRLSAVGFVFGLAAASFHLAPPGSRSPDE